MRNSKSESYDLVNGKITHKSHIINKGKKGVRQIMQSYNGFTSSQKHMISRIIFVLKKSQKLNTEQINETLFNLKIPAYSNKSIYSCLKELQMMGIVTCKIVKTKKNENEIITDYFSLTEIADIFREQLLADGFSPERTRKTQVKEFAIIKCPKCNVYRVGHCQFKKIKCFNCSEVLLPTNIIICVNTKEEAILLLKKIKSAI